MIGAFAGVSPVVRALLAAAFTWGMTAAGAALVFGTKNVPRKLLDAMLGFAAGVMIAASFWSFWRPPSSYRRRGPLPLWVPPVIGLQPGGVPAAARPGAAPSAPGPEDIRGRGYPHQLAAQCSWSQPLRCSTSPA